MSEKSSGKCMETQELTPSRFRHSPFMLSKYNIRFGDKCQEDLRLITKVSLGATSL